jgi:hypothetical protein
MTNRTKAREQTVPSTLAGIFDQQTQIRHIYSSSHFDIPADAQTMPSARAMFTTNLPYRPSKLSQPALTYPPIPIDTETRSYSRPTAKLLAYDTPLSPPPREPMLWLWTCHLCRRTYPLGATRRCLEDGHFFCAGITEAKMLSRKEGKKVYRRHTPCSSEFDYRGWKAWGEWRRRQLTLPDLRRGTPWTRGCGCFCDFPSECRWDLSPACSSPAAAGLLPSSTDGGSESELETGSSTNGDGVSRKESGDGIWKRRNSMSAMRKESQ